MGSAEKKIIILGAGRVGSSVAQSLVTERYDITVVDVAAEALHDLQARLDIRTLVGSGCHPEVLEQAGAQHADMLLAVTSSDEVNITACQVASLLFHTPRKIARIRSAKFLSHPELFSEKGIPIDVIFNPDQIVAGYIYRLIEYPTAFQVLDFANGLVELVAVKAYQEGPLVGHQLADLREHLPGIEARVAAIFRSEQSIIPEGKTVIQAGDEVFFIAAPKHIRAVMAELRKLERPVRRVMLAGGGHIGGRLAQRLEEAGYAAKVIEIHEGTARMLADELAKTVVLTGDATDEELLLSEGIEDVDTFCALTNDDEDNILSAMLAKRLGAHKVIALINRPTYVDLVQRSTNIDIVISPQQATIGSLLRHLRRGKVSTVHSLRQGAAEAMETVVKGTPTTSRIIGRAIQDIELPPASTIGAVVRDHEVLMAHHDVVIQPGDHLILFVVDKRQIPAVERLFQPKAG